MRLFKIDFSSAQKSDIKLHTTTLMALSFSKRSEKFASGDIGLTIATITAAQDLVRQWSKDFPELRSCRTGRPSKKAPFRVAMVLAEEFFKATQRPPKRKTDPYNGNKVSGDFFELIQDVFAALSIDASAAAMTRKAADQWDRRHSAQTRKAKLGVSIRRKKGNTTIRIFSKL